MPQNCRNIIKQDELKMNKHITNEIYFIFLAVFKRFENVFQATSIWTKRWKHASHVSHKETYVQEYHARVVNEH